MARVEGWFERYGARHRLLHPDAADRPHLHLDARRRRPHALLASSRSTRPLGCIPWVLMLGFIGVKVGENWEEWRDKLHYFDYVVIAGHHRPRRSTCWSSGAAATERTATAEPRDRAPARGLEAGPSDGARPTPITPPARAVALGAVQGPTELLPVSSSAHLTLIPWLADWDWDSLDPELRKSFEVALHARRRRGAADRPARG